MGAGTPNRIVAIDGPAAAGKSTVARALADALGALLFDTGALYRVVTLLALRNRTPTTDGKALAKLARTAQIRVTTPSIADGRLFDVTVDGEDVTWRIRAADIDERVSAVSAHPDVRCALLEPQRLIARQGRVVIVGRDIGTVVVPDASVKIYLNASPEERARRRQRELHDRGLSPTFEDVLADIRRRDDIDSSRNIAPLRAADDAVIVSTDGLSVPEVVARLKQIVDAAWRQATPPS
jgi:cytidylate kinase